MTTNSLLNSPVWNLFQEEARKRRHDPMALLIAYMNERLEIWEDEALDEEVNEQARQSGYEEDDAVMLVRKHRQEKKQSRASS